MLKILSVVGTRPEAIKMAPVIKELAKYQGKVSSRVCITAQHRQMLDQALQLFGILPDYDLDVMDDHQTPTQVASMVLSKLESLLLAERPDWVLVQGDTTTVMAASLAAFYAGSKVGHVEAGLRTYDKLRPFPEEMNRRVAGVVADLHFAPTRRACQNLLREGVRKETIHVTGNPVMDALQWIAAQPPSPDVITLLRQLGVPSSRFILVTAHRRENFGRPLENICLALREIAARNQGRVRIVYPVHPNPNVWGPVHHLLESVPDIILISPLDYLSLVHLMKQAHLVITDSGGIQEEAPGLGKPVLVLRDVTERPEAIEAGTVQLVGTNRERIIAETQRLLENPDTYRQMTRAVNPYGDGRAAERITHALLERPFEPFGG